MWWDKRGIFYTDSWWKSEIWWKMDDLLCFHTPEIELYLFCNNLFLELALHSLIFKGFISLTLVFSFKPWNVFGCLFGHQWLLTRVPLPPFQAILPACLQPAKDWKKWYKGLRKRKGRGEGKALQKMRRKMNLHLLLDS